MPSPLFTFVGPPLKDLLPQQAITEMAYQGGPMAEAFQAALNEVQNRPAPEQMPVPGRVNPFAAMASIFSGQLAENLGARGTAGAARENIAQREQAAMQAEHYNQQVKQADLIQKRKDKIDLLLQIGEAKQKLYEQQGNMSAAEKQAKDNLNYLTKQFALSKDLAEFKSNLKVKELGAWKEGTKAGGGGTPSGGTTKKALTDKLEKFRDESGTITITPGSPDDMELGRLIQQAIPDPAAQKAFIDSLGIVFK